MVYSCHCNRPGVAILRSNLRRGHIWALGWVCNEAGACMTLYVSTYHIVNNPHSYRRGPTIWDNDISPSAAPSLWLSDLCWGLQLLLCGCMSHAFAAAETVHHHLRHPHISKTHQAIHDATAHGLPGISRPVHNNALHSLSASCRILMLLLRCTGARKSFAEVSGARQAVFSTLCRASRLQVEATSWR